MEVISQYHEVAATFLARIFLGLLFFFQGYDTVFNVRIKNVIYTYNRTFLNKGIPKFITIWASWFTSCSSLIGGLLLVIGLYEYFALYVLGINLLISAIGFGIHTPMWDTRFVFPRLILIIFLLIVPTTWNLWSLDHLFFSECINNCEKASN